MIFFSRYILPILLVTVCQYPLLAQQATVTNSLGMEFVLVKPGSFISGKFQPPYPKPSATSAGDKPASERAYNAREFALAEKLARQDALPGFTVTIKLPYYIGRYEVTQAQWTKVMGGNPSVFKSDKVEDDTGQHPVDNVTWEDVQAFLKKLNAMDNGHVYRLPSEFEWEYAARAGATDDISWPEIRLSAQLGTRTTMQVGRKKPNEWGLYDMLGNVWEWVEDYYNEKIFADPIPPKSGRNHVLKGASFVGDVKNATYMTHAAGPGNKWDIGFRVVMTVK
jgi:formylglycine-generating enzyme required for sulfatase activity